jgi:tetratricopeptide (TPR) repeat protein
MINIIILKDKNEKLISKYIKKAKDSIENNYYEDAKKYCEEIIKLDENNAYVHLYLGVCYYYNNDYYMAEEEYKKAIDIDNKFGKAYANIGFIMHNQGKYESAIKYFEIAKKYDPSVITCIEDSQNMLNKCGDFNSD